MGFYDLNVPAAEEGDGNGMPARNTLKLVIKLMGLGYSGIAYNRFVRLGDNCVDNSGELIFPKPAKPLQVSSFLAASPLLRADVRFHREVLGVSLKQPFRQYSRATVEIQNMVQMSAFKKLRAELKDYDLVAVCPLDFAVFEDICQKADADIICINFGVNLPFHMKKSLVKTAIERGLFFEIMYSPMVASHVARRETLANVRALIDWSGGRNLIISSGANLVKDLRGPYDVANMSTLFGISMEHTKAAVSKNCKDVILRGLERKRLRITVKRAPPSGALRSHQAKIKVSDIWDPMSSGDGDVDLTALLNDNLNLFMGSLSEETQQHCPSKVMPSNNSVNYNISQPAQVLAPNDFRNIQTSGDAGKEAFTSVFSSDVLDEVRQAVELKENDVETTCENLDLSFLNPIHRAVGCSPKTEFQKSTETLAGINTMDYSNITKPRGSLKAKELVCSTPFADISAEDTLRPDEGGKHSMRFGIKAAQRHSKTERLKDALRPLGGVVKSTTSKKRKHSGKGKRIKQGRK